MWAILSFFLGIPVYYVMYFLMKDWHRHDERGVRLVRAASEALVKAGVLSAPLVKTAVVPRRSFWLYFPLTLVTLGLFALYWWYVLIADGNRHFDVQEQ